jgi:hypothetical protein
VRKGRKEKEEKVEYCYNDKEERKASYDLWRIDLKIQQGNGFIG